MLPSCWDMPWIFRVEYHLGLLLSFFSCCMALTISVCLGGFSFITMDCWVVFRSCSRSWAGADKISPKCSCHLCTCSSTAVICLPSFPFAREAVLAKLFFANCLVILYSSREFLRSVACAKFSTHVRLSFLAAFFTALLASRYCRTLQIPLN